MKKNCNDGRKILVEYPGETRQAIDGGVPIKVGDYVMVQMGIVIKTLPAEEAAYALEAWKSA